MTLAVTPQMLGQTLRCPKCKEQFCVPAAAATPLPPALARHSQSIQATVPYQQAAPQQIGRFQVRAPLGSGTFGTVYRAYDPQVDREVALKVPLPGTLDDPARRERFLREARASAQLRHPHIVPLFETGTEPTLYLVSAYVEGHTLEAALHGEPMDLRQAAGIVHDLAEALAFAHGLGIIHRDVKPANVILDGKGEPHLLDFGLAHRQEGEEKLTREGDLLGTPAYMAPELVTERDREAQPTTDQYALGVVLYELLTGQTPFAGLPEVVLFNAIRTEVPRPSKARPGLPRDLETVCLKAMARRPEERYGSCQEMADDLRRWLEREPIRARRLGMGERLVRWCRRKPAVAGLTTAVAACLMLGTLVASFLATRAHEQTRRAEDALTQASQEKQRAEQAATQAREEKRRAEAATTQARQEKQRADEKAESARKSEAVAREQRDQAEWLAYVGQIRLAQHEWRDHNFRIFRFKVQSPGFRGFSAAVPLARISVGMPVW